MEKMLIGSEETRDFFVQAFKTNKLVPILGSGFSCGMPARKRNSIPTGSQLKEHMIKVICNERKEFSETMLKGKSFSWISERFFKCSIDKISDYFFDNFTGIKTEQRNIKCTCREHTACHGTKHK